MNRSTVIPIVIIIAAVLVAGYVIYTRNNNSAPMVASLPGYQSSSMNPGVGNTDTANTNTTGTTNNSATLNQPNLFQQGGNDSSSSSGTLLQQVSMPQAGFVVIQTDTNGAPGQVLGSSKLLNAGANSSVAIPTMAPIVPQASYYVSLYTDNNGNGQFDAGTDQLMVGSGGQVMQQTFTAPAQQSSGSSSPSMMP